MAVKAIAKISHFTLDADDTFTITLDIAANGQSVQNVAGGQFNGSQTSAVINAALVASAKQYALDNMGASFGIGDLARLIDGVNLV